MDTGDRGAPQMVVVMPEDSGEVVVTLRMVVWWLGWIVEGALVGLIVAGLR